MPSLEGVHTISSPAPSPDVHEVVIAVEAAQLTRSQPYLPGAVPGVAAVGRVVAAGEQALSLLEQRVLVGGVDPCGQCEVCRRGGGTVCPRAHHRGSDARGTLAQRITVAGKWVVPLGGELGLDGAQAAASDAAGAEAAGAEATRPKRGPSDPAALAVLGGDAVLAYTMYARSDLAPREPVVVLGSSPVTRFLVEVLLAKGLMPVVVRERIVDADGYQQSDGGWRGWLEDRRVPSVVWDAGAGDLDETREEIEEALGRRDAAATSAAAATAAAAATSAAAPAGESSATGAAPAGETSATGAASAGETSATGTATAAASSTAASGNESQRGRPWKILASEPRCLLLATRLAGPRAVVTVVVPQTTSGATNQATPASYASGAGSPESLLGSLMAGAGGEPAPDPLRGMTVDPRAWMREVSVVSVTAASPELILETAALVARGELDLDGGVAVVELSDLAPEQVEALGPTRSLVVRVPKLEG